MILPILSTLLLIKAAVSQPDTNATCSPSFAWAANSRGQSPCLVAAYLGSVCNNGLFFVPSLPDGSFYNGPTVAQANSCGCSSVFYSLLSACAACQSRNFQPWSSFDANCTTVDSQIFRGNIPSETAVPHWAYQNVSSGSFNTTLAQLQLNAPESTANVQPTSTNLPGGSTSTPTSKKKSNAGAIAGGVVGGIVFVCLAGIATFWFLRRRRRSAAPSNLAATPMAYHSTGNTSITPFTSFTASPPPKLYDPDDPSTFPSSSSGLHNPARVNSPAYSGHTLTEPRTQYSGAPEV
ncbi:hypothetical protein R3P38DRAFT_1214265 [Favolaschia claudopus]|uniref:Uncharacterized protein n=1 Tax=Favolaschia claudopus TaxID=2862362 RepID=A0AAW0B6R8_9AGAR